MSEARICWVTGLTGTARPRPTPATAVLTPIRRARPSTRAPPELPGLSAASVWMTLSITRETAPWRAGRLRPRPLITPAVTEPARPMGLPTATTSWPMRSFSASPSSTPPRPRGPHPPAGSPPAGPRTRAGPPRGGGGAPRRARRVQAPPLGHAQARHDRDAQRGEGLVLVPGAGRPGDLAAELALR